MSEREVIRVDGAEEDPTNIFPVDIYDLTSNAGLDVARGFYFHIPLDPETGEILRQSDAVVHLAGPHDTRDAALEAARSFIREALAEPLTSNEAA